MAVEAVVLQERLQLIQEQQKERFKSRKTLLIKRDYSENVCPDQKGEQFRAHHPDSVDFDQSTNLDLRTATQEDKTEELCRPMKDNIVDKELSQVHTSEGTSGHKTVEEAEYFRGQVEKLQLNTARLKSELKLKERKVLELEKVREEESAALGMTGTSATQRIVELSKRNRELNAELAAEKNRVRQLQKKLKDREKSLTQKEGSTEASRNGKVSAHSKLNKHNDGIVLPNLQDDSATVIAQLQDQLQQLKMKMVEQRNQCQVLKQELKLAHKVITKEVGKGVTVSALLSGVSGWRGRAQQIISLQNRLAELSEQLRLTKLNNSAHVSRTTSSECCDTYLAGQTVDIRQKAALQKLETGKQKNLDVVRSELETLTSDYSQIRQQCSALKARNKTLTSSVKSLKAEIISLTKKQSQYDTLISSLRATNSDRYVGQDERDILQDLERENRLLRQDNQSLQSKLSELKAVKRSTKVEFNAHQTPSALPPVISRPDQRSVGQTERKAVSAGQPLGSFHPHTDLNEPSICMLVSQVERDRLLELTSCLQQRLDATTDKLVRLDIETRTLRQQNVRLEKIVKRSKTTGGTGSKADNEHDKVEELETHLAIQMDVNAVLKETLELTRHEKVEDIKQYQKMLQETKKLLMNEIQTDLKY